MKRKSVAVLALLIIFALLSSGLMSFASYSNTVEARNSYRRGHLSPPAPSATPSPTSTPTPTADPTAAPSPTPTATPKPTAAPTPTASPTASPSPTPTPAPTSGPLWLHTSGQNIYDSSGNQVKLYTCVLMDGDGNHIAQSDLQKIKNDGFNTIRLFIEWGLIQPNSPTSINTAYFSSASGASPTIGAGVDYVVNWASSLGMYVILCPDWTPSWQPPAWAVTASGGIGLGNPDTGNSPLIDMLNNPTVQSGVNYLYNWMAQRYASKSNVIFESFNELQTSNSPATNIQITEFAAFNNGWVSAIQSGEGANSHLIALELLYDWSSFNYVLTGPFITGTHANIMLATHDYPLVDGTANWAQSCAQEWSTTIHNAGYPWLDTEFSSAIGGGYGIPGLTYAMQLYVTYGAAGWAYFAYDSGATTFSNFNINNPANSATILSVIQPQMVQP